jgi:hypothetical protein
LNWTPSFRLRKKPTVYSKTLGRSFTIVEDWWLKKQQLN